ncbi:MAG: hypothetical protein RLZZ338_3364 [Cyanobacteriota bacterium]|jgi:hypothetical protein
MFTLSTPFSGSFANLIFFLSLDISSNRRSNGRISLPYNRFGMVMRNRVPPRDGTGNQDFVTKPGAQGACLILFGEAGGYPGARSYSVVTKSS